MKEKAMNGSLSMAQFQRIVGLTEEERNQIPFAADRHTLALTLLGVSWYADKLGITLREVADLALSMNAEEKEKLNDYDESPE